MLDWNLKWQEPSWGLPDAKAGDYVLDYVDRVQWVKNVKVLGIWALVRGTSLDIYTLIERDRETERELHKIELDFFGKWQDAPVQFHIYRDRKALQEQVAGVEPILAAP